MEDSYNLETLELLTRSAWLGSRRSSERVPRMDRRVYINHLSDGEPMKSDGTPMSNIPPGAKAVPCSEATNDCLEPNGSGRGKNANRNFCSPRAKHRFGARRLFCPARSLEACALPSHSSNRQRCDAQRLGLG